MKTGLFLILMFLIARTAEAQEYPEMIKVDGGTFTLGDTEGVGGSYSRPAHAVTLKTFMIAKTETTIEQYQLFCNATGKEIPQEVSVAPAKLKNPITYVTWQDALDYCIWLSKKTGKPHRLPTEAEWEYAAKGGKKSKGFQFSGSDNLGDVAWHSKNTEYYMMPVAQKLPNELGLHDMTGNAFEWCSDWYAPYTAEAQNNPKGPATGTQRILRGMGKGNDETDSHMVNRMTYNPAKPSKYFSFRVVQADK
ncbi:MAG: SUMF1/EgtB/PvdO family nonheme iron enzyme [Bacteroidota bacterium]